MQNINTLDDPARTAAPGCAPGEHNPTDAEDREYFRNFQEAYDEFFFRTKWNIESVLAGDKDGVKVLYKNLIQTLDRGELFEVLTEGTSMEDLAVLLAPDRCVDDTDAVEIFKDGLIAALAKTTAKRLAELSMQGVLV